MKSFITAVSLLILIVLFIAGCATTMMVGGTVKRVDLKSNTITITTPMGEEEAIQINKDTKITKEGIQRSIDDLRRTGDHVQIYYLRPDSSVLAKSIIVGVIVPRCSCGYGCPCPITRGCKVIRY